jgi:hypothetical protein
LMTGGFMVDEPQAEVMKVADKIRPAKSGFVIGVSQTRTR